MADVEISYKGSQIATMSATGVKTLLTGDTFCEDDIVVSYNKPSSSLQSKTVSPTTSQQTVSPDSGYDGLSSVIVNAMPVGSAKVPNKSYSPSISISVDDETGEIQAYGSGSYTLAPTVTAGYVSSGTSGTISVSVWDSYQLTVYEGEHHQPPIFTVSLTNPVNSSYFDSCEIYDTTNGETKIGEITSATGSVSLDLTDRFALWDVDTLHLWITLEYKSGGFIHVDTSKISCTGDVSYDGYSYGIQLTVTGAGTVVIDGVDYNYGA